MNIMKSSISTKYFKVSDIALFVLIIGLFIFFTISSPYFLTFSNLMNMLQAVSVIGIASAAVTLGMIGCGIDLTIGAIMACTSCLAVQIVSRFGLPWYVGFIAAFALGALIGYLNGVVITFGKLPPMVATLGMNSVIRGIGYVFTNAQTVYISDKAFTWWGVGRIGEVPICGIILIASFALWQFVSQYTSFGRKAYATGGNRESAKLAGINTDKIIRTLYMFNGLFAAIAGIVMTGIVSGGIPNAGETYGTDITTAVVLGGTKIGTGEGNVLRTLLGLLAIGILNNGMTLLNVPQYWQMVSKGALMLLAVIVAERNK